MMSTDPLAFTRIICGIVVQMSWINSKTNTMGDHQFFFSFALFLSLCHSPSFPCGTFTNIYFHTFIYIHAHLNIIRCTQYDGHLLTSPCFPPNSITQFFIHTWFGSSCSFGMRAKHCVCMYIFVWLGLCLCLCLGLCY